MKAVIFDFDGVIANSEPKHFAALQRVLAEEGIHISLADYYRLYLAYDDKTAFAVAFRNASKPMPDIGSLIERKAHYFNSSETSIYPDAIRLIHRLSDRYLLAINSGARRSEIAQVLTKFELTPFFKVIVSTEDITRCKPNPEGYLLALKQLNADYCLNLEPQDCTAIEDSVGGIASAIAAGMKCIAVANTYTIDELASTKASLVVSTLDNVTDEVLAHIFGERN